MNIICFLRPPRGPLWRPSDPPAEHPRPALHHAPAARPVEQMRDGALHAKGSVSAVSGGATSPKERAASRCDEPTEGTLTWLEHVQASPGRWKYMASNWATNASSVALFWGVSAGSRNSTVYVSASVRTVRSVVSKSTGRRCVMTAARGPWASVASSKSWSKQRLEHPPKQPGPSSRPNLRRGRALSRSVRWRRSHSSRASRPAPDRDLLAGAALRPVAAHDLEGGPEAAAPERLAGRPDDRAGRLRPPRPPVEGPCVEPHGVQACRRPGAARGARAGTAGDAFCKSSQRPRSTRAGGYGGQRRTHRHRVGKALARDGVDDVEVEQEAVVGGAPELCAACGRDGRRVSRPPEASALACDPLAERTVRDHLHFTCLLSQSATPRGGGPRVLTGGEPRSGGRTRRTRSAGPSSRT